MSKVILQFFLTFVFCVTVLGVSIPSQAKPPTPDPNPEKVILSMEGGEYVNYFANTPVKDYAFEHFSSVNDAFDLIYHSVLFTPTPDGISYTVEVKRISELPTDPAKGVILELDDDDSEFVKLSDSAAVSIYGIVFTGFYIGSNGYITFIEGDEEYSESLENHFDTLRVSGLFRDLDPEAAGQVSWKQLADRVAVTWENVTVHNAENSNTFQIELFYDGSIRLSWLGVDAQLGIVGLSDGQGIPQDFQETDFSDLAPPPVLDDYLTEQFDSAEEDDFDLSYSSVTFYPTADQATYIGILEDINELPINPFGGTDLKLRDDNYAWVGLSNDARVKIFNQSFSTFFVGSNGYITFTRPDNDNSETLAEHFNTLRISGLYTDLTAAYTGIVSGIQFYDRVAITWEAVPEFSHTGENTFQIEMFYDGRIRISWLYTPSPSNIVGLSNGLGLPDNFKETDFSVDYALKP